MGDWFYMPSNDVNGYDHAEFSPVIYFELKFQFLGEIYCDNGFVFVNTFKLIFKQFLCGELSVCSLFGMSITV